MIYAKEKKFSLFSLSSITDINYRISGNYGKVELAMSLNSFSVDLFGPAVNICSKINQLAPSNKMVIHENLYQVIKRMSFYEDYIFKEINTAYVNNIRTNNPSNNNNTNIFGNINSNNKKNYPYIAYSVGHINKDKIDPKRIKEERLFESHIARQSKPNSYFNILLIDDDEDILFTFTSIIENQGYKITSFSNPQQALNHFVKTNPYFYDLIIMDIRMPELNGIKLYSKIKVLNPDIKILFVSALNGVEEMLSIFPELKQSDILSKPIEPQLLLDRVGTAIRTQ